MSKALVTVLMPVFNADRYLDAAIQSILDQSLKDFYFMIINDGSTDRSGDIIQSFVEKDARINYVRQENKGLSNSLNEGITRCKTPYIARMDADDIALPARLEKQLRFLENHQEIDVLGTQAITIDENGNELERGTSPQTDHQIKWSLFFRTSLAHPSIMVRKSVFEKVGLFKVDTRTEKIPEDYELWTRSADQLKFSNLPDYLLKYRKVSSSLSHDGNTFFNRATLQISKTHMEKAVGRALSTDQIDRLIHEIPGKEDPGKIEERIDYLNELYTRFMNANVLNAEDRTWVDDHFAQRLSITLGALRRVSVSKFMTRIGSLLLFHPRKFGLWLKIQLRK